MFNIFELDILEEDLGRWKGWYFHPLGDSQLETLMELLERQRRIRTLDKRYAHTRVLWRKLEVEAKGLYESI
jgi:hypothetical protein